MDEITKLIEGGETARLELKSSLADSRRIVETIAAIATIGGGCLLIGVRPSGEVAGVELGEETVEQLVQRVLVHTDPRVYVDVERIALDGADVLRITVPPGDGPHLAYGRAFHRVGPATVPMSRDEYERRLLDRMRESGGYERQTIGLGIDAIDEGAVSRFVELARERGVSAEDPARAVLERLHLLRGDELTVAATLLFAREPQGPLPQATVRASARRGAFEEAATLEGTVFQQVEGAAAFVARNLRQRVSRENLVRQETPELPSAAVREVIVNALAHRDYRSTAPVQLRVDDGGLSVWNPGHFAPPITPAMLRQEHPSVPTNPLLARALYLAGYLEEWGTGTLRVIEAMRAASQPDPLFEETRGGIGVRLPFAGTDDARLNERQASLLEAVQYGGVFTTAEHAARTGVAHRTALQDILDLESLGFVERRGRGKATRWVRR